mgnify:CR=1 FL=1
MMCVGFSDCNGSKRGGGADAGWTGEQGLRSAVPCGSILCRSIHSGECASELFYAKAKCGSAVIRLTRHKVPPVQVEDEKLMFQMIRASFNQRRKTLVNGLNHSPEMTLTKEQITKAVEGLGKAPA